MHPPPPSMRLHRALLRTLLFVLLGAGLTLGAVTACTTHSFYDRSMTAPATGRGSAPGDATIRGPFDEIWVIARTPRVEGADANEVAPGRGALLAAEANNDGSRRIFPLEHTDVQATIEGPIASVRVAQRFGNPYAETIEAVYVFPLPHDAAVSDFTLTIGERTIRGIIRPRDEAEQLYRQARAAGHVASLLTEERPNIFTERVANIEPGHTIDVALTYYNMVPYENGQHEWRFPLVIGPRYSALAGPGGVSAIPVGGHASRGGAAAGHATTGTAIEYLKPGDSTQRTVSIAVALNAGADLREIISPSHASATIVRSGATATIALDGGDEIAERDFLLRWSVAGEVPTAVLIASASPAAQDGTGTFAFTLYPPATREVGLRAPLELIFVLDRSGSMSGRPIAQVQEAIIAAVDDLEPSDAFQIVDFSESATALRGSMLAGTEDNKWMARRYVEGLTAGGGTRVLEGLRTALALPHREGRSRYLIFLTDAFVDNEQEVFAALHRDLGEGRVFALGVGRAPNWHLLDGMARAGQGAVAALPLDEDAATTMRVFMDRVQRPILHGITIDWEGGAVRDLWPPRIPDLVADRPITVLGRYSGAPPHGAILKARLGDQAIESPIALAPTLAPGQTLDRLWGRAKIAQLSLDATWRGRDREQIAKEIATTALAHGLMSPYTAFIAVDASRATGGADRRTIVQPSPMPSGVRYDTTVSTSDGG